MHEVARAGLHATGSDALDRAGRPPLTGSSVASDHTLWASPQIVPACCLGVSLWTDLQEFYEDRMPDLALQWLDMENPGILKSR